VVVPQKDLDGAVCLFHVLNSLDASRSEHVNEALWQRLVFNPVNFVRNVVSLSNGLGPLA
jgi:hypothetical protein